MQLKNKVKKIYFPHTVKHLKKKLNDSNSCHNIETMSIKFKMLLTFLANSIQINLGSSKARLFQWLLVSLWCGLCRERGMLGLFRILGRRLKWCRTCFIPMSLFRPTVLTFLNPFPWVSLSLDGFQYAHLRVRPTWWGA